MNAGMDDDIIDTVLDEQVAGSSGEYGHVTVIGGSGTYRNTPGIVATAALRGSCDLVTVVAPEPSAENASQFTLNVMTAALSENQVVEDDVSVLVERTDWADCTVIGPGLGRNEATQDAIRHYLRSTDAPLVIDADALHVMADNPGFAEPDWVLTPHAGEFELLTDETPPDDIDERAQLVEEYAAVFGCTILLKGAVDVVSNGERTETNDTGNAYMTKGGTGDVLAGLTAALRTRQFDPFESACAAAYFNGYAGDHALATYGRGFLLEEMLESVSIVMSPELEE
jgi:NAD(P)H-hydrate epimerase